MSKASKTERTIQRLRDERDEAREKLAHSEAVTEALSLGAKELRRRADALQAKLYAAAINESTLLDYIEEHGFVVTEDSTGVVVRIDAPGAQQS